MDEKTDSKELIVGAIWDEAATVEAEILELEDVISLRPAVSGTELEKIRVGQGASLEEYEPQELTEKHLQRLRRTAAALWGLADYVEGLPATDPHLLQLKDLNLITFFNMLDVKAGYPRLHQLDHWPLGHSTKAVLNGFRADPADDRSYDALLDEFVKAAKEDYDFYNQTT